MNTPELFTNPQVHPYTSEDEKVYQRELVEYLNTTLAKKYVSAELLLESNSNIVYKVIERDTNQPSILKFVNERPSRNEEYAALTYWERNNVVVPHCIERTEIELSNYTTYMLNMEFVDGENMFSKFKLGKNYLTQEYGLTIANTLKTIDIPYSGDVSVFSDCLYTPKLEKLLSVPQFKTEVTAAYEVYQQWRLHNQVTLVHGDFRDGNLLKTTKGITIIDPDPSLGHIATDFSYYIIRSYISKFTSHLDGFVQAFLNSRTDEELIKAVTLLECARLYASFNQENPGTQRQRILEVMEMAVDGSLFTGDRFKQQT